MFRSFLCMMWIFFVYDVDLFCVRRERWHGFMLQNKSWEERLHLDSNDVGVTADLKRNHADFTCGIN